MVCIHSSFFPVLTFQRKFIPRKYRVTQHLRGDERLHANLVEGKDVLLVEEDPLPSHSVVHRRAGRIMAIMARKASAA